jgi:hypothetical protein
MNRDDSDEGLEEPGVESEDQFYQLMSNIKTFKKDREDKEKELKRMDELSKVIKEVGYGGVREYIGQKVPPVYPDHAEVRLRP